MSEDPEGPTVRHAIVQYNLQFSVIVVATSVALFVFGKWPGAVGVLVSPCAVATMSLRLSKTVVSTKNPLPIGMMVVAFMLGALPGVIILVVGYLTGDHFTIFVLTACGASLIGFSGLMIAISRSSPLT